MNKCVCLLSGGMDSTALVTKLVRDGLHPLCVSFDYGQRHRKELRYAARTAEKLQLRHLVLEAPIQSSSALRGHSDIPENLAPSDSGQSPTVVPGRNLVLVSLAMTVGEGPVYLGCNADDAAVYADCRPSFITHLSLATQHAYGRSVEAPFVSMTKRDIYRLYRELGLKASDSWSCYNGRGTACGVCGPCIAIQEAKESWAK